MKINNIIKATLSSMAALATTAVAAFAQRGEEIACIAKPAEGLSVAAVTQGMSFILAGGVGPILILVVAFIVGMVISHVLWGGF